MAKKTRKIVTVRKISKNLAVNRLITDGCGEKNYSETVLFRDINHCLLAIQLAGNYNWKGVQYDVLLLVERPVR